MEKYKVKGYNGWWSEIDEYQDYMLLEHCTYGDETCSLVVRKDNPQEVICETFEDIISALEEEGIL